MKVSITSQKGGVGKTTISLNLAHSLSIAEHRTLLIDADPQGCLGYMLAPGKKQPSGLYDLLRQPQKTLREVIRATRSPNLSILFSGQAEGYSEVETADTLGFRLGVKTLMEQAEELGFESIVVDCPAGLFSPAISFALASDVAIIPQQAEFLSILSTPKSLQTYRSLTRQSRALKKIGILFSMVKYSSVESRNLMNQIKEEVLPDEIFQTVIPRSELFNRASSLGVPVSLLPNSTVEAQAFDNLRDEILQLASS